jgi:hypothetical protein
MSFSKEQELGNDCGETVASLIIKWVDQGCDTLDVVECIAQSIGCILVSSQVMGVQDTSVRTITAAEAGDMVAEFVEDGFKSTRMMMLEEQSLVTPPK